MLGNELDREKETLDILIKICSHKKLPAASASSLKKQPDQVAHLSADDANEYQNSSNHINTLIIHLQVFKDQFIDQRAFHEKPQENKQPSDFHKLLESLCKLLQNRSWLEQVTDDLLAKVVSVLRILLRDKLFHSGFYHLGGVKILAQLLARITHIYLSHGETQERLEVLQELTNIFQKVSAVTEQKTWLTEQEVHKTLLLLLSSQSMAVLHVSLHTLVSLAQSDSSRKKIVEVNCFDIFHTILQDYELSSKKLAASLLRLLCADPRARSALRSLHGGSIIAVLLSLLRAQSQRLVCHALWCLVQLCEDDDVTRSVVRHTGGIPLLLSLLGEQTTLKPLDRMSPHTRTASETSRGEEDDAPQHYSMALKSTVCTCLSELARNDINSWTIVQSNGVYILGTLLFLPEDFNSVSKAVIHVQGNAFRTLRFLFSLERNRRLFKRLFPPELYEGFIDIGHYERKLSLYTDLAQKFDNLPRESLTEVQQAIEGLNHRKEPTQHIGEYAVLELLGFGAFGQVYKVRKTKSKHEESYLAMKEIPVSVNPMWGKSKKDVMQSVGDVMNELSVIRKQLTHPNIVKYKQTFFQSDKLYVVMELIEGAPLREHITSLKEKSEKFSEARVWGIVIQLVRALRYLHKEKHILHRDLTPNNVMLGDLDKVTITDFGLAKQKQKDCSQMMSVVGTILYSCPEIIKHEPYGEKADIWALGCVVYQMLTLEPPFYSSNIISLAKLIVEAQYTPLPTTGGYSSLLREMVSRCLEPEADKRPDIIGVAACIAEQLLVHADQQQHVQTKLTRRLETEKRRAQHSHPTANRYHRLFIESQQRYRNATDENAPMSSQQHGRRGNRNTSDETDMLSDEFRSSLRIISDTSSPADSLSSPGFSPSIARPGWINEKVEATDILWSEEDSSLSSGNDSKVFLNLDQPIINNKPFRLYEPPKKHSYKPPLRPSSLNPVSRPLSVNVVQSCDSGVYGDQPSPAGSLPSPANQTSANATAMATASQSNTLSFQNPAVTSITCKSCTLTHSYTCPLDNQSEISEQFIPAESPWGSNQSDPSSYKGIIQSSADSNSQTPEAAPGLKKGLLKRSMSTPASERNTKTTGKVRPSSARTPTVTVSQAHLRQVNDPVLQMVHQLHKIIYISQLPPSLTPSHARQLVNRYKRSLFSVRSSPYSLKQELHRLVNLSSEHIHPTLLSPGPSLGLASDTGLPTVSLGLQGAQGGEGEEGMTYEQLHNHIEEVLQGSGYYNVPIHRGDMHV